MDLTRLEGSLARMLDWIRSVDTKCSIVIGLSLAMLAVLGSTSPEVGRCDWLKIVFLCAGAAPQVVVLIYCWIAMRPQTREPPSVPPSLIYFGSIARLSQSEFRRLMRDETCEIYAKDLVSQIHRNAEIANAKYRAVRTASLWLFMGMFTWLPSIYLLYMEVSWV